MSMFSLCWDCCICACGGCCLAGNGDDDYVKATKEQVIERLDKRQYDTSRKKMIDYLKTQFDYDYQEIPKQFDEKTVIFYLKYMIEFREFHKEESIDFVKKLLSDKVDMQDADVLEAMKRFMLY